MVPNMPFGSRMSLFGGIGLDADGPSVLVRRNAQVCKEQAQLRALTLDSS